MSTDSAEDRLSHFYFSDLASMSPFMPSTVYMRCMTRAIIRVNTIAGIGPTLKLQLLGAQSDVEGLLLDVGNNPP